MKVLMLDIDGCLNSEQSAVFWHNKRDQTKWENELYKEWQGSLKEYLALEFCPIAVSNLEELMRRVPELKIVISSTWRYGETVETLKAMFKPFKLISDAIIGLTPNIGLTPRGNEIQAWLDKHPEVDKFVIVDDNRDMVHLTDRLVHISPIHGFLYGDMLKAVKMLNNT
jgi:hypothetical protein